jgi:HAE1 family hydrophobic/amphiphilic exporter-1
MVPLEQIATVTMGKGPGQIQHADGKRTITVAPTPRGVRPARSPPRPEAGRGHGVPARVRLELAGSSRDQQEVFTAMGIALVWAWR